MFQAKLSFSDYLKIFVPGSIFTIGTWYLHRPFITKYFPYIAGDINTQSIGNLNIQFKVLFFIVFATCCGVILYSLSDLAIVMVSDDEAKTDKATKIGRSLLRAIGVLLGGWVILPDQRINSINRYLSSERKVIFKEMVSEWGLVTERELSDPDGKIKAHQHIVVHLRTLPNAVDAEKSLSDHLFFTGSIYLAALSLFPISILSFLTTYLLSNEVLHHSYEILLLLFFFTYIGCVFSAYILRRRVHHYYSHILTLALHFFIEIKKQRQDLLSKK